MDEQTRQAFKVNLINLVKGHRETCDKCFGENCDVSLNLIYTMMKEAGYDFTKEEQALFI